MLSKLIYIRNMYSTYQDSLIAYLEIYRLTYCNCMDATHVFYSKQHNTTHLTTQISTFQ